MEASRKEEDLGFSIEKEFIWSLLVAVHRVFSMSPYFSLVNLIKFQTDS
jgi:hypothetical protein